MIHVSDVEAALPWYRQLFEPTKLLRHQADEIAILDVEGFSLEIVKADDKVSSGKSGSVLYWSVNNLQSTLEKFMANGATLYRGPILVESGLAMCQVEDPFGNLIGLRGNPAL